MVIIQFRNNAQIIVSKQPITSQKAEKFEEDLFKKDLIKWLLQFIFSNFKIHI